MVVLFAIGTSLAGSDSEDFKIIKKYLSPPSKLFTAYNMRHQGRGISTINYQIHSLLPVGTEIQKVTLTNSDGQTWAYDVNKGRTISGQVDFEFTEPQDSVEFVTSNGETYRLKFERRYNPNSSIWSFARRMFTKKSPSQMFSDMNEEDISAIKAGLVLESMSMKQVVMSLGIPPKHRTPDAANNFTWLYWINRFKKKKVCFDMGKRTIRCGTVAEGRRSPI
jgi:hypothetical protein